MSDNLIAGLWFAVSVLGISAITVILFALIVWAINYKID